MVQKFAFTIIVTFLVQSSLAEVCNYNEKCVLKTNCKNTDGRGIFDKRIDGLDCDLTINVCCDMTKVIVKTMEEILETDQVGICGVRISDNLNTRIDTAGENYNEVEAEFGEFPWMISVMKYEVIGGITLKVQFCGGSLIHPQMVLTSAHKFFEKTSESFFARAGDWDLKTENEMFPFVDKEVQEIIMHPQYNDDNLYFDLALLQLKEPFLLKKYINTICLPPKGFNFDKSTCVGSGWGKDKPDGEYQHILKKIDLPMVPNERCQAMFRNTKLGPDFVLDESLICAGGEKGKDTCHGDGGSPLICPIPGTTNRYYEAGVVAYGVGCGEENVPGTYANVQLMRDWIDDEMLGKVFDTASYTYIP